jgi:hypothetical protein
MEGRKPMRVSAAAAAAFSAIILFASCPLTSKDPLSDPSSASIDPALVGEWRMFDEDTAETNRLIVLGFSDREYVLIAKGDAEDEIEVYRAFVTEIGTERFLNVRELGGTNEPWNFINYRIAEGRMEFRIVDDKLFESKNLDTSEELRNSILTHLSDPLLYGEGGGKKSDWMLERIEKKPAAQ